MGYDVHQYVMPGVVGAYTNGLDATILANYGTVITDYDFAVVPYKNHAAWDAADDFGVLMIEGLPVPLFLPTGWQGLSKDRAFGITSSIDTNYRFYCYSWKNIELCSYGFQAQKDSGFTYAGTWEALMQPSRTTNSATLDYVRMFRYQSSTGWVYCDLDGGKTSISSQMPIMMQEAIEAGHIPSPPKQLMIAHDIDDFPGSPGANHPSTLADCQALYAVMETYGIPMTWGFYVDLIDQYDQDVIDFIAARTPDKGGLIYPIDHNSDGSSSWCGETYSTIDGWHAASVAALQAEGIKSGSDVAGENQWGYRYSVNNEFDGIGALFCAKKGINVSRVTESTIEGGIADGSVAKLAANSMTNLYPEYNIQPQEYGGIRLVNGMNNYPSAAGIDIDLDVAEDLKTAYQAVERGMVINSGMLGGVNYGHAQNAEASVTNSCMLWALDTMGQLANEMPTLFRWVHGSAK